MIYALAILAPLVLWVFFLAYIPLAKYEHLLRPEVRAVGIVVILAGVLIDISFNWTFGLLLGITPDLTLSQKCGRLKKGNDWRAAVARYLCSNWLDPFEVGGHCK